VTEPRTLSSADIEAIAKATAREVREGLKDEIYRELGKGMLGWALKCLFAALVTVAVYTGVNFTGVKGLK
jgi:hypothetical protein